MSMLVCCMSPWSQVHAARNRNVLDYKGLVFYFDQIHPDGITGHRCAAAAAAAAPTGGGMHRGYRENYSKAQSKSGTRTGGACLGASSMPLPTAQLPCMTMMYGCCAFTCMQGYG